VHPVEIDNTYCMQHAI